MVFNLGLGDCLDRLKDIKDNFVDSIVTDPPYGISFKNQDWDYEVPSVSVWKECLRVLKPGGHLLSFSSPRTYHRIAINIEDAGFEIKDQIMWVYGSGFPKSGNLKPAHEPIVLARKPLDKNSIKENVEEYGTGSLNISDCRVGDERIKINKLENWSGFGELKRPDYTSTVSYGRYPANFIHDGLEEEWSKYFYCAKANKKDKEDYNNHPTVKPIDLMRYLCRLVTPKDGFVLDPYMGSGSTGKAAILEAFNFIGIELSKDYYDIAEKRINKAIKDISLND